MENKMHVKTGDTVAILSGRDAGKQGKVIVEKLNMVTKHVKPRRAGEEGGIVKAEGAIYASKVQIVCPHCKKLTRVGHKVHDEQKPNGGVKHVSERVCKKCGETL